MTIQVRTVDSLAAYIDLVLATFGERRKKKYTDPFDDPQELEETWFRGQSKASHGLLPGAYRRAWQHTTVFNRFRAAGACTLIPSPHSEWEWYFAAQHYELPTRLLDWTVDPLAALFFSLQGMHADDQRVLHDLADPPVVWVMDAGSLNCLSYGADEVIVPKDDGWFSQNWLPSHMGEAPTIFQNGGVSYSNEKPIAVWPVLTTPRIIAQSGCFTVHGTSHDPIDSLFSAAPPGPHADRMQKVLIAAPDRVQRELSDLGVNKLRLFPELQNVAGRLRYHYLP